MKDHTNAEAAESDWRGLYMLGAAAALAGITGTLFDIVLTMVPGWEAATAPTTVQAWFAQFAANPLLGMRNLDFLNLVLSLIALPMYVAILGAHRRTRPAFSLLALLVVGIGAVLFVSNNAALPMLELSRRYAPAGAPAERAALEGAAQALLARGAHGSFGAFLGFFVSEVGTLMTAVAMLRGRVFRRPTAWMGIAGASMLAVYTTLMTFAPGSGALVNAVAIPGGLLMIAWNVAVARTLYGLAGRRRVHAQAPSNSTRGLRGAVDHG